ncbi:hypothetical protein [Nocardioides marmorisolisilvae]|uniref:Uncharacterized protein n=1 Tax=Nocardioides marmorisolisilvae TaxID=1542737 RepID=A0A3N0DTG5_9ACTN|nr:hypothetical protein [Nocardioides marmorisolisilvae]RNL78919.1 hypothetical protein EFL95_07660 [Nocardioides marmorisolisilvae]
MSDPQPASHRADQPAEEPEVVAPWGDGFGDFMRWRSRALLTWSAWRIWLFAGIGLVGLVTGVLDHDNEGLATGAEVTGVVLGLFFVPPLVADALKRFKGRIEP